ncbi:MAG: hypothetical protein HZRFUVUK_001436 [Candidatus Fervidibacterota bacterium]|jgi:anti-anti-sigma factor
MMVERIPIELRDDGIAIVSPEGELDLSTAEALRERLKEAISVASVGVIVDLSRVNFMDSVTLGVLLGGMKKAKDKGIEFVLASPSEHDRRVISMVHLDSVFKLCDELEEAIKLMLSSRG